MPTNNSVARLVIDNAPHAIAYFDTELRYQYANPRWMQNFRLQDNDLIGNSLFDVSKNLPPRWKKIFARVLEGETMRGKADAFEQGPRTFYISWEACPWYTDTGEIGGLIMYTEDVTDDMLNRMLVEAAENLEAERDKLLRTVMDYAPLILTVFDRDGIVRHTEGRGLELLGITPDTIVGQSAFDLYTGDDALAESAVLDRVRQGLAGQQATDTLQVLGRYYETRYYPIKDPEGKMKELISVSFDVTERVETERQLETTSAVAQGLYETARRVANASTMDDLLMTLSAGGRRRGAKSSGIFKIVTDRRHNPTHIETIAAWDRHDNILIPVGTTFELGQFPMAQLWLNSPDKPFMVSDLHDDDRIDAATRAVMEQADVRAFVFVPLRRAGRWIGVLTINWDEPHTFTGLEQRLYDALGSIASPAVETLNTLETLRHTAEDRRRLIRELEESLLFKDQFLSTMSHELRTPLNAILGYAGIVMDEDDLSEDVHYMLGRIEGNSRRLLTLINDVLDISRINADRVRLVQKPIALTATVQAWHADFLPQAQEKQLTLLLEHDATLPDHILADEERLAQVVGNLLQNAIKFTPEGTITLRTRLHDDDYWQLQIIDSGVGIPETWQHLIFDEFRQVDATSRRKYGGAGLGLSIVKKLVVLMGGTIGVESKLNEGSTFTVTLPLQTTTDATPTTDATAAVPE